MEDLLHKDITYDIRGACFWVWKEFRGAFKEKIIDRALTIELQKRGRLVEDQKRINIYYQGQKVGQYIPDKIIDNSVLVELKSKEFITQGDIDQFWKYLKASEYKVGMLINFGPKNLEIKCVVYDGARTPEVSRLDQRQASALKSAEKGFTLMEIMVATVIFALMASATLALFNYVLKINRRTEALRQASQGARDFVEFLVKEVRNGQIDYGVQDPNATQLSPAYPIGPCTVPSTAITAGTASYGNQDNRLAIVNTDNVEECFYYGQGGGTAYAGQGVFATSTGGTLVLNKVGVSSPQILNPPNFTVQNLMFIIRPTKDPYVAAGGLAKVQPFVTIIIKFMVQLPTGEQVPIYYQTSVSSNKYDIPNS